MAMVVVQNNSKQNQKQPKMASEVRVAVTKLQELPQGQNNNNVMDLV